MPCEPMRVVQSSLAPWQMEQLSTSPAVSSAPPFPDEDAPEVPETAAALTALALKNLDERFFPLGGMILQQIYREQFSWMRFSRRGGS